MRPGILPRGPAPPCRPADAPPCASVERLARATTAAGRLPLASKRGMVFDPLLWRQCARLVHHLPVRPVVARVGNAGRKVFVMDHLHLGDAFEHETTWCLRRSSPAPWRPGPQTSRRSSQMSASPSFLKSSKAVNSRLIWCTPGAWLFTAAIVWWRPSAAHIQLISQALVRCDKRKPQTAFISSAQSFGSTEVKFTWPTHFGCTPRPR
jgi:hypothetical protein